MRASAVVSLGTVVRTSGATREPAIGPGDALIVNLVVPDSSAACSPRSSLSRRRSTASLSITTRPPAPSRGRLIPKPSSPPQSEGIKRWKQSTRRLR